MPKKPLSVTLDQENLLWLQGRAASRKRRSLSDALDEIVTTARLGGLAADAPRSVVGTIDIAADDPDLAKADAYVREVFERSQAQSWLVRERPPARRRPARSRRG